MDAFSINTNVSSLPQIIIKGPGTAIQQIRALDSKQCILLCTPVIPHPPGSPTSHQRIDPFEPLGRALGTHHGRIRHVPYVLNVGMTDTHRLHLAQAGAVIVAICAQAGSTDAQQSFAQAISHVMSRGLYEAKPSMLIFVSVRSGQGRLPTIPHFHTVLEIDSYTPPALQRVADTIFGR